MLSHQATRLRLSTGLSNVGVTVGDPDKHSLRKRCNRTSVETRDEQGEGIGRSGSFKEACCEGSKKWGDGERMT